MGPDGGGLRTQPARAPERAQGRASEVQWREETRARPSAAHPRSCPQIWNDYKLKWDPSDYDGAEFMRVPAQKIWKPDIVLYNK